MSTEKQIEANQRNAQLSTGPKTADGKARAARNAITHGLTSRDVVLNNEDGDEYQKLLDACVERYDNGDPLQMALIQVATRAYWRLDRIAIAETARINHGVRHAIIDWKKHQTDRALELGQQLRYDPVDRVNPQLQDPEAIKQMAVWKSFDPAKIVNELKSFSTGIDWMVEQWETLLRVLDEDGFLHYQEKYLVAKLLGVRPDDALWDSRVTDLFLWCHALHPSEMGLFEHFQEAAIGAEGKGPYDERVFGLTHGKAPMTKLEARENLEAAIQGEIRRLLVFKAEEVGPAEAEDLAEIHKQALAETSPASLLTHRYQTTCLNELLKAKAELVRCSPTSPAGTAPKPPAPQNPPAPPAPAPPVNPVRHDAHLADAVKPIPTPPVVRNEPNFRGDAMLLSTPRGTDTESISVLRPGG